MLHRTFLGTNPIDALLRQPRSLSRLFIGELFVLLLPVCSFMNKLFNIELGLSKEVKLSFFLGTTVEGGRGRNVNESQPRFRWG